MTVISCINRKLAAGLISQDMANRLTTLYNRALLEQQHLPSHLAILLAANKALAAIKHQLYKTRQQGILRTQAMLRFESIMSNGDKQHAGRRVNDELFRVEDAVSQRRQLYLREIDQIADDVMRAYRDGTLTDRILDQEIRHRGTTGNAVASQIADAWDVAIKRALPLYDEAGGDMRVRQDWMYPQSHDPGRMFAAGEDAWVKEIFPRLDRSQMVDLDTLLPLTDTELDLVLRNIYRDITTNGAASRNPTARSGQPSLGNRLSSERVLQFAGSEYIRYHEQFGKGNLYETMVQYLMGIARDTAMMERLSPNPNYIHNFVLNRLETIGSQIDGRVNLRMRNAIDNTFKSLLGIRPPVSNETMAEFFQSTRNLQASSMLGTASFASLFLDPPMAYLNSIMTHSSFFDYLKVLSSRLAQSQTAKDAAARLGVRSQVYRDVLLHNIRDAVDIHQIPIRDTVSSRAVELTRSLARTTSQLSLMNAITTAEQEAGRMMILMNIGRETSNSWGQLHELTRRMLSDAGLRPSEWELLRHAPLDTYGNAWSVDNTIQYLQAQNVPDAVQIASRVHQAVMAEAAYSTVEPGVRFGRMITNTRRGTLGGELWLNTLQFSSVPIEHAMRWIPRVIRSDMGFSRYLQANVVTQAAILLTLSGAMYLQTRHLVKGDDIEDMTSVNFWFRAFLQGGAGSIVADALNRAMGEGTTTAWLGLIGGPAAGNAWGIFANVFDTFNTDQFGRSLTRPEDWLSSIQSLTPVFGSLWYTRAAYRHMIMDQLSQMMDPMYAMRMAQRRINDQLRGRTYWWQPGDALPDRLPSISPPPSQIGNAPHRAR